MGDNIKKRGIIKSKLTLFTKFVDGLTDNVSEVEVFQLKDRLLHVESVKDEFERIQSVLELESDQDDILNAHMSEREKFEKTYFIQISKVKKLIADFEKQNLPDTQSQSSANHTENILNNLDTFSRIKLPTINLPKFEGSYQNWLEFRDTYKSLIHDNEAISSVQKFHYLRASLEGAAAQVIKSLEMSSANYDVAWKTLSERYDNNKLLIHNHVRTLFNCEPIAKESAWAIRKLSDTLVKNLRALEQLKQPINQWDTLLLYLVTTKLDAVTLREWENYKKDLDIPVFNDFQKFLKARANLLEMVSETHPDSKRKAGAASNTRGFLATGGAQNIPCCAVCKGNHYIQNCGDFLKLSAKERMSKVLYIKLCINCLKGGHTNKVCRRGNCTKCNLKHNTLLHMDKRDSSHTETPASSNFCESTLNNDNLITNDTTELAMSACSSIDHVFLSTIYVQVLGKNNEIQTVRALLDSGAQSSFVSSGLFKRLQVEGVDADVTVKGINGIASNISTKCKLNVHSLHSAFQFTNDFFVIHTISQNIPMASINISELNIPSNLTLADPTFFKPEKVEMLIGADIFWSLIGVGQIMLGRDKPVLQNTKFGWVVSGPLGKRNKNVTCNFIQQEDTESNINKILTKFWEIENLDLNPKMSVDETTCEMQFNKTVKRNSDGRFIVTLPLKCDTNKLGDSYNIAYKRFLNLERKLESNPEFKQLYVSFLREYLELNHMVKVKNVTDVPLGYYMPHRGVLRKDSITTKMRVVFDASSPSTSGYSLNHLLLVGPSLQQELFSILLRFRQHKYVVSADIAKMYRQVLLNPEQRCLQRILFRENSNEPLNCYELQTVTYGTASASYLSIRCLLQLAVENESQQPELSQIIKTDFYVDDLLTGADTIEEAALICSGVSNILKQGCFELRKFYSNNPEVLKYVQSDGDEAMVIDFSEHENAKTLGVSWIPSSDRLVYKINNFTESRITKRTILSELAQIFDPLGLLAPCVILAKGLLQRLWLEKLTWDEPVPKHIYTFWRQFKTELPMLNNLRVQRHVICDNAIEVELHGFSDASEALFGTSIYIRSVDNSGQSHIHLLCAKSKVAPLKTISVPRLELSAALLLARLANKVRTSLRIKFKRCIFWSDSTVVLGWLKSPPNKFKTFVSNRISEIQELTSSDTWRHVRSEHNPADVVSRGVKPAALLSNDLWWHGPPWLLQDEDSWPCKKIDDKNLPDTKSKQEKLSLTIFTDNFLNFAKRFSTLIKLKRTTAWIYRFYKNCQFKINGLPSNKNVLSSTEISEAFSIIVKLDQHASFKSEIEKLSSGATVDSNSKLLNLNPFLDENGFLRVGGRLANSKFSFEKRYPIILDSKSHVMLLIARQTHADLLHAGPQHMLATIRDTFWPIGGRILVKSVVRKCVSCYRFKPTITKPIMAALPEQRLDPRQPFEVTGVDYAGPLSMKNRPGRGCKLTKVYICIFICSVTKAIHIELVTDLTKDGFLLALKRFIARRGQPSQILSDNATNFVAARNEIRELGKFMLENEQELVEHFHKNSINWKFNPPYGPHFGGLWEAGVRSIKHHLRRVTKGVSLTFEQLYTLLTQVEAILNSRPLSPLSNSPHDLNPLTPAHFLVGRPLTMMPEPNVSNQPPNRLTLFQHLTQLKQHIWNRWSKEYVNELQIRTKWKKHYDALQDGALVLIKEENLPPMKWKLGRVQSVYKGPDGVGRVATIVTENGLIKRPFTKICPLPIEVTSASPSDTAEASLIQCGEE